MSKYEFGVVMGVMIAIVFIAGMWLTWVLMHKLIHPPEPRYLSVCNMCGGACYLGSDGISLCDKCKEDFQDA